jgi:hypothetical protein
MAYLTGVYNHLISYIGARRLMIDRGGIRHKCDLRTWRYLTRELEDGLIKADDDVSASQDTGHESGMPTYDRNKEGVLGDYRDMAAQSR